MTCPSCRAEVPAGARFCSECGQDLRLRGDERRVVTVLFADLVGYTALSETLDPEQVKNLIDGCFERLVADIDAFGGRVDKIIGDAIVALFGAPLAHEDDAERAVRAALRMQETLALASAELGVDVQMRVGVNTGEVLVGALRAGGDYTAMGDVVNTASRLQSAAPTGGVLVGPSTYAATRRVISYEPLDPIDVKGREALVPAWRADATMAPPGYRGERDRAVLVGRDAEMGLLRHSVDSSVRNARASLLLVLGEAGVGKSRLVEELAATVERDHKAIVLEGRCVPYGEANVWWPIADAIRYGAGIRSSDPEDTARDLTETAVRTALGDGTAEEVDRALQGLLYLMGYDSDLRGIDPVRAREEATGAVVTCLDRFAAQHPVLLVLSDLHWADDLVLEMLDTLLERLAGRRFVVLATARRAVEERWHPPHGGRHNLVVLTLDPLTAESAAALLSELAGDDIGAELADALLERSGGNPFFLEELVTLLVDAGVVGSGAATGSVLGAIELPDTLRGLVAARLDGLPTEERRVLEDCAVLGRRGPISAIQVMAQKRLRLDDVMPVLRSLEDKELLLLSGEGPRATWTFRSDVVREVAYGTLTKADRARSHQGIAAWIEAHEDTGRDDIVDRITHHYVRAAELAQELGGVDGLPGDVWEVALRWLERAAERAEQAEMSIVAERLFGEGLRLLAGHHGARHRMFLTGRARALAHQHDLAPARADAAAAIDEARSVGDQAHLARALLVLADIEQKEGEGDGGEATLDEAGAVFEALGDEAGCAEVQRLRGFGALFRHDYGRATELLEDAMARFEALGDRRGVAWALQNLAWCAFYSGHAEEAEARLRKAADTFAEIGDKGGLGWARGLLAWTRFQQGHSHEAGALAESIIDDVRCRGDRWALGMMLVLLGSVRLWTGHAADAISCLEEARDIFRTINDRFGEMQAAAVLGRALLATGRITEAFDVLTPSDHPASIPRPVADDDRERLFALVGPLGASVQVGDVGRTTELLAVFRSLAPAQQSSTDLLVGDGERAVALALHRLQLGDAEGAVEAVVPLRDRILPKVDPNVTSAAALALAAAGAVDEALAAADQVDGHEGASYLDAIVAGVARGLALARRGDHAAATAAFDQVRAAADATDDRLWRAYTRLAGAIAASSRDDADAADRMCEAERHLADLGLEDTGWRRACTLALGLSPAA